MKAKFRLTSTKAYEVEDGENWDAEDAVKAIQAAIVKAKEAGGYDIELVMDTSYSCSKDYEVRVSYKVAMSDKEIVAEAIRTFADPESRRTAYEILKKEFEFNESQLR